MRRLHGGLLAAVLLMAGCGPGGNPDSTTQTPAPVATPSVAVSTVAIAAARPAEGTLTVLVTTPDDVSSPGLDAAVSVLMERPELRVVVAAPLLDGTGSGAIEEGRTMSGFPVHVVDAPAGDVLALAMAHLDVTPDLTVIGFVEGPALGAGIDSSPVATQVAAARALSVPSLAVTAGTEHGPDHAAAGSMLRSVLDIDLDDVLRPGAHILTVPSCDGGSVRGPLEVDRSTERSAAAAIDCASAASGVPEDDVTAHEQGYATLVALAPR